MTFRDDSRCHLGLSPNPCAWDHVAAALLPGVGGSRKVRLCPCHADRRASLSINPGDVQRVIWHCGAECDAGDIRLALLDKGVHETCLGRYGLPKQSAALRLRLASPDLATVADALRWREFRKLPAGLNGSLLRMCGQAISDGNGDLPGDPFKLLPVDRDDFLALAKRTGLDRGYAYRVYKQWMAYPG